MSYIRGYRYDVVPGSSNKYSTNHKEIQNPAYATTIALSAKSPDSDQLHFDMAQLTGALTLTMDIAQPYAGDKATIVFGADGTNRVVTFSTGTVAAGTITVLANKFATIRFVFSSLANAWVEEGRYVQS